jgi:lipoprotein LprG
LAGLVLVGLGTVGCLQQQPKELTPAELVQKAGDALKQVKSLHFKLSSANGKMAIGTGLFAQSIDGDVVQPDRLKGTATATFGKVTVDVGFVVIGSNEYITNPITKRWQQLNPTGSAPNLLDPNRGAPSLLTQTTNLQKQANETVDGTECFHLKGQVPGSLVAGLIGTKTSTATLAGEIWIGTTDYLPRQILLAGPITSDEPPDIQRTLSLSNFNESVTIDPPATG